MDVPESIPHHAFMVALGELGMDTKDLRRITADPTGMDLTYLVRGEDGKLISYGNGVAEVSYRVRFARGE